jgi:iron complex outermembrane receptor protein
MLRSGHLKGWLLGSVSLCLGVAAAPAFAQSAAAGDSNSTPATTKPSGVESIVVTARRKPEVLFNVPAPVTVVSRKTLEEFDVTDVKSIINLVPNAVVPKDPDNYALYITIRGIQQVDVNAPPNFGVYRNGIYAGGYRPDPGPLIDLDRVELVAGPQAGLYGRDAVGGTLNFVYATPASTYGGYLTGSYGRYDHSELQGAINIPLTDNFAVRATGWYENQNEGELYNATLNQYVDKNSHEGARLSAKWTPVDDLSVVWMAEYSQNSGPSIETYAPNGVRNLLEHSPSETSGLIYRNTPNISDNHQTYLSQDVNYKTTIGTFELLSSYSQYHLNDTEDADQTALDPSTGPAASTVLNRNESTRNIYNELDWYSPENKPITVTAGLSYFDQVFGLAKLYTTTMDLNQFSGANGSLICSALLANPSCPGIPGGAFPALGLQTAQFGAPNGGSNIETHSFSAFAELTYHFNKQLSITGTLRYTDDIEAINFHQSALSPSTPGAQYIIDLYANTFPTINLVHSYTYSNVSPGVVLNYKPSDSINVYALYNTGFRAGGFNTVTTTAALIPYGSEQAQNFEAGIKTLWLNDRLGINVDAFLMFQNHLLEYEPDPIAPPQFYFYYLENVGSSKTYGVEASATARITDWWNASLSIGWEKPQLTGGASYGYALAGSNQELTRTWTISATTGFKYPVTDMYAVIGGINWTYESGGYLDITTIPWPSQNRLDATLGVAAGPVSLVAYVNNALNSRPPEFVYGNAATTLVDGETYGLRFSAKF